ncbi:hypothetical protein R8Z57_15210 [Microbacterium sp. M3]|uniref:Transmembrane protein n=1 Tax=Microbacterium arthrosphaerae TaxID=792652 RepID=A0ABU4H464_9MICO|nr:MULTISPECIES: hypothetical protein [Microbacterium]MDW4574128.1 hypothetical protein [Microbacterium arthrosphaerae]MDW7607983.1 hypothetical protein [Microbacterium sp. M3]
MTTPPNPRLRAERVRAARHRRAIGYWWVVIGWLLSLWIGASVVPHAWVHAPALFGHLAAVIVGLGAAVLLEVTGLLWMLRRSSLEDLRRVERTVTTLAWAGIVVLFATGAFLQPDLSQPLTALKMLAVLVAAMNGVAMTRLTAELGRLPGTVRFSALPSRLKLWCLWSAVVSQAAWWTAVLIGMLNTASR